jgi:uncharacterized protein YbbC (DUF1343 family)
MIMRSKVSRLVSIILSVLGVFAVNFFNRKDAKHAKCMKQFGSNVLLVVGILIFSGCFASVAPTTKPAEPEEDFQEPQKFRLGAERTEAYLPLLRESRVGLLVNQSSRIGERHLVDSLLALEINVLRIFSPEHGFRGAADAGEKISDETDAATGLPIVSLYGSKKKPSPADLAGIDIMVYDLQDVGARFYTYLSTLHYLMEACAENDIPLLVLDRPNPNGHYVDGPILESAQKSFVGMHPIPIVHGMTLGELARMINGEGWLGEGRRCDLSVIACEAYARTIPYELPVPPSPNLPNMRSIYLYPSLCLFEGTTVSVGRGTEAPFQLYGAPGFPGGDFTFTPAPGPGSKDPLHKGKLCRGFDLRKLEPAQIREKTGLDLAYLLDFYREYPDKQRFFLANNFFDRLAGTDQLRKQIQEGWTEAQIRAAWEPGLQDFLERRKPYLLY